VCGAAWWIFDVPLIWTGLMGLRNKAEVLALLNKADPNINYGRVAGSVIVPRMIAEHPWTGIGMGNYPVMRNDPKYLGLMMPVRNYDLAGVGLLGVAGELGIPALLALYGMMMYPAFRVYRTNGNAVLLTLALCQPYVHLMGAQITYFYPWLASAFVLSYLPLRAASKSVPQSALARPSLGPALSGGMGAAG
jgi:O-antigen ligase